MKPTKGRIVFYTHDGSDPGRAAGVQDPAIVQAVNPDGTLNVWVFGSTRVEMQDNVSAGGPNADVASPGTWMWPPRES